MPCEVSRIFGNRQLPFPLAKPMLKHPGLLLAGALQRPVATSISPGETGVSPLSGAAGSMNGTANSAYIQYSTMTAARLPRFV